MQTPTAPLTPAQRDILKLFEADLPESEWERARDVLAEHFASRAVEEANRAWDANGWTDEDAERLLRGHDRRRA